MTSSRQAVGERLVAAILARDAEGVRACVAPDAVFWSNLSGEQSRDEFASMCDHLVASVPDVEYSRLRRLDTEAGFVQQHELVGTSPAGSPFRVKACVVATVVDDRIVRFEEYMDAGQASGIGL